MTGTTSVPAGSTALVVDDDEFATETMALTLSSLGVAEVHRAEDGQKALKLLASLQREPDFLVCDVFMPNMDGVEFLDKLAARGYGGGVLIVTGVDPAMLSFTRTLAKGGSLRVLGTFVKPVAREELARALILPRE